MTDHQIKAITKWFIDNSNRPLSKQDKEIIKQAVDESDSMGELNLILTQSNFYHLCCQKQILPHRHISKMQFL